MSIKKLVIGLAVFAMVFGVAVSANAQALSAEQIMQALLANPTLLQQLSGLLGGSTAAPAASAYTRDLAIGATGADVIALQTFLEGKGFLVMPVGVAKGYFGPATSAAVSKYQVSVGLPAAGRVGPQTRVVLNSVVVVPPTPGTPGTPATPSTPSALEGKNGELEDVDHLSQYTAKDVGDGQDDVIVTGFDFEASADGDISINSMKVEFDPTGNTGSNNMNDFISSVSVWMGSEEVGRADVDEFNESSSHIYSKNINLDNAVIRADKKEKFYVKVDAATNFDSSDIGAADSWEVDLSSVRVEDGSGVVITDSTTGDIDVASAKVAVDFVSFSTAADTELKFSSATGNPIESTVIIEANAETNDVVLLKGKMKLEGTSDVTLDQLPITFTVAGTANTMDDVVGTAYLVIDGTEYSENPTTSGLASTVTFDNLNLDIDGGSTVNFEVRVDLLEVDGAPAAEGDTITASFTATNADYVDVENEEGDQLTDDTEKTGTVTGRAQTLRTAGISVKKLSSDFTSSETTGNDNDLGTFTLKFSVTNNGDDAIYVSSVPVATTTASLSTVGYVAAIVDRAGTATVGGVTVGLVNDSDTVKESSGTYAISGGDTENFTLTATVALPSAGAGALYRLNLGGVWWDTVDTDESPDTAQYTTNLGIGGNVSTDQKGLN